MDQDRGSAHLPPRSPPRSPSRPKPLHIRKQLSQAQIVQSHQQSDQDQDYQDYYENSAYQSRSLSAGNHEQRFDSYGARASQTEATSGADKSARSSQSSHRGRYRSNSSIKVPSSSTARSTVSSYKQSYISDASPEIMGDFVPINPLDVVSRPATADGSKAVFHKYASLNYFHQTILTATSSINARKFPKVVNPYEFEPSTPDSNNTRQPPTRLLGSQDDMFVSSPPKFSHTKNARSMGDALYAARSPSPPVAYISKPPSCGIHRSESSPTVSPLHFQPPFERSPSPEFHFYLPEDDSPLSTLSRGRQQLENISHGHDQHGVERRSRSPAHQSTTPTARVSPPRPSRMPYPEPAHYASSRPLPRSPTKTLHDVSEQDEFEVSQLIKSPSPPPVPPKKRSRSPMKKMFGEHGWLGQSPSEKPEPKLQSKKFFARGNGDMHERKKTTMMGKLKSKLEEIVRSPHQQQ